MTHNGSVGTQLVPEEIHDIRGTTVRGEDNNTLGEVIDDMICDECTKTGSSWVHLRTCQTCGVTLCCDSSPNRHATKHAHSSRHPVIASAEPGERWLYCYVDETFAQY